jgi:hypothetical protein
MALGVREPTQDFFELANQVSIRIWTGFITYYVLSYSHLKLGGSVVLQVGCLLNHITQKSAI